MGPALQFIAGENVTDTIQSTPTQPLVVQVRDNGKPVAGVVVHFEATVPSPGITNMQVGEIGKNSFQSVATATTDSEGRAGVRLRFGDVAGAASVSVSAPANGLTASARYTIRPGAAIGIGLFPRDTAIHHPGSFVLRGLVLDRLFNGRSDPVTYEAVGSSARVDSSGRVTSTGLGFTRVRVRAQLGSTSYADSVTIVVVAPSAVAWSRAGQLVVGDLSGAFRSLGAAGLAASFEPGGNRLVYTRNGQLWLIDLAGNVTALPTAGVSGATWPEFSRDGRWVYFQSGDNRIFRVHPDGTAVEQLSPGQGSFATASPDSSFIAYSTGVVTILNLATRAERSIPNASGYGLRWSPDGQWIAFTNNGALMIVHPDGTGLRQLGNRFMVGGLVWSPDSRIILGFSAGKGVLTEVSTGIMASVWLYDEYPAWAY